MRKLRKSLALILVLVMAFSVMLPIAGARTFNIVEDFNDAEDVASGQRMALDVLAALDVLVGEDGNIFPQREVTRAEAATIVARILLGPQAARQLPAGQTGFRDVDGVSGTLFAQGAIAYLHQQGIVIGIGDGLFDPFGPVTGAEMATMFLRAVGFGVNGEYTGPRWETNAIVDGMQWRVLWGVGDIDFTAPATREQVFRYAYNALNSSNSNVGLRFVNWSADRQAYVPVLLQGIEQPGAGDDGNLMTIWRRVFLQAPYNARRSGADGVPAATDIFARPAVRYTRGGIEIGLYPTAPRLSYTSFQSELDVRRAIDQFSVAATVNGLVNGRNSGWPIGGANIAGNLAANISAMSGNGVLLEIWVNAQNEITTVSAIRTDISEVAAINAARTQFWLEVLTRDGDDGIHTAGFGTGERLLVDSLHPLFDEVSDLAIGDRILVSPTFRNTTLGEVGKVAFPETVTGVLQSSATMVNFAGNTGSLTVDGTVYRRAQVLTSGARQAIMTAANTQVNLVLDTYGFIVDTHTAGVSARQLMFVRATANGLHNGAITPMVRGWWPDGTEADVMVTGVPDGNAVGAMPEASWIVRFVGTGANVTWERWDDQAVATIPATTASIISTVASINPITALSANQVSLVVGGRNLRFADDAMYFFWDDGTTTGRAPAFAVRDRSAAVPNLSGVQILAVVEYRVWGQDPVISALWIGAPATAAINANNLVFVHTDAEFTGGSMHTVMIDGTAYQTFRAYNVNGQPITWNAPAGWPVTPGQSWIAIAEDPNGLNNASGWYTFRVDSNNRFVLTRVDNDVYDNLGIFTNVVATANGLSTTLLPIVYGGNVISARMDTSTVVIDLNPDRYIEMETDQFFSINDRGTLVRFIQQQPAGSVRVAVAFDARNTDLASVVFIYR